MLLKDWAIYSRIGFEKGFVPKAFGMNPFLFVFDGSL